MVNSKDINGKDFSGAIKGLAIILMITHHSFGFPEYYISNISYPSLERYIWLIRDVTKICVPIFVFLTGGGYYLRKNYTAQYSLSKIKKILLSYWIVYAVLLFISVILGYTPTFQDIILELFGLKLYVMWFCWYVGFYISLMVIFPVFSKLMKIKDNFKWNILNSLIFCMILQVIAKIAEPIDTYSVFSELSAFFPVAAVGFMFAKYDIGNKIVNKVTNIVWIRIVIGVLFILTAFAGHGLKPYVKGVSVGIIVAPLFIIGVYLVRVCNISCIRKLLMFLGKHSMNIWFLHCLFFSLATREIFQPIAYIVRIPILVVAWILLLCVGMSFPIEKMQKAVFSFEDKVKQYL